MYSHMSVMFGKTRRQKSVWSDSLRASPLEDDTAGGGVFCTSVHRTNISNLTGLETCHITANQSTAINKMNNKLSKLHFICLFIPTKVAIISNVWCLEICAGTLFLMLLKFGAVLSIICVFSMVVLYLDPFTAMYRCLAVVSEEDNTTLANSLQTWSLERESNKFQCVLDRGLNLHRK